jgi:hypothetical protein
MKVNILSLVRLFKKLRRTLPLTSSVSRSNPQILVSSQLNSKVKAASMQVVHIEILSLTYAKNYNLMCSHY